ncbi:magnesium/cobalt transporter CorA [Pantoea latae]|uniref:Magnesium transport protein CorA n=1 Tax=Pantoea latae TaxID=1964541 RepID=A0A1V9DQF0_9GAMM|nr:magnesium/cobalt transporter CorA [Pantoea latae]OQP36077.1 magnesium and cobalt transport protein CorA [Pantoea latae]
MILNCMVYRPGQAGQELDVEKISDVMSEPDAFIWLGLYQPEAEFMHKIQREFGLHELAVEDALCAHQRPKIEQYGESMFIVAKTVSSENEHLHFGETHFFVGKNFLITLRHGASDSYAPIRERIEQNSALLAHGPGYPLYCILDFIVDRYGEFTASLGDKIGKMEAALFRSEFDSAAVKSVYRLRRELLSLRNAAQPLEEICQQLVRLHEDIVPKELRAYLRDVQDHARHVVTDAEDMREMLTSAMHVNLAMVAVQQNEVTKKLAGWGAILVVPTVIFSMYGMNFKDMPELNSPLGYPLALGATFVACFLLWWRLRKSGWL